MSNITITERHLDAAYEAGSTRAKAERMLGVESPQLEIDDSDVADIAYSITGYKLDVECEEAQDLVTAYSDGYADGWED